MNKFYQIVVYTKARKDRFEVCKDVLLVDKASGATKIKPRMLCNRNGAISHLQTEMGFVDDFHYSLCN